MIQSLTYSACIRQELGGYCFQIRNWENIESNLATYLISGYCGILWGPTQGITTDTFEVSSDATSKTVNSFMLGSCHLDRTSNVNIGIEF